MNLWRHCTRDRILGTATALGVAGLCTTFAYHNRHAMPRRTAANAAPPDHAQLRESLERIWTAGPVPKLFAFDLDYTLWPLWVDTHVSTPIKRSPPTAINRVVDRYGETMSFFPHVPSILLFLREKRVKVAAASRTSAPNAARQALTGLVLQDPSSGDEVKSISFFHFQEIYPGSKITHFQRIAADSGIEYEDMIFFDDEHRNIEVDTKLGVQFVLVGSQGTDIATFEQGLREWRARKQAAEKERI